eukprot:jgi/Psemu1/292184/fgenesh1_pg.942_\
MDEEKGVRRQKRGLRFLGSSSPRNEYESLAVVEPEPDDELSDAEEDNPNNPNESDRVDDEYGDGDEEGIFYFILWSQLAMAWCWGMYVNGIAVYGRDPVLTCEYSYFLTIDNRCPYIACYLEGLADVNNTNITEMVPVDWRNCSATEGFHP